MLNTARRAKMFATTACDRKAAQQDKEIRREETMSTIAENPADATTSVHAPKRWLYGPGPSQVYPRVYQAMAQPVVGHLDPYFFQISQGVQKGLRMVFGTENEFTLPISATGSGGMETAISNFVEPGTKVAIIVGGFFGERICEMAKR